MKESFENFKQYVYGKILLKTPCTESEHAIRKCDGGPGVQETYFTELFHRLPADTFRAILEVRHVGERRYWESGSRKRGRSAYGPGLM